MDRKVNRKEKEMKVKEINGERKKVHSPKKLRKK